MTKVGAAARTVGAAVALALAALACARPDYADCAFSCAASEACPGDLSCEQGWCRAAGATGACGEGDSDGGEGVVFDAALADATPSCWDPSPSNIDECALADPEAAWVITSDVTIDTSTGTILGPVPPLALTLDQGLDAPGLFVIVAHSVDLPADKRITAGGSRALVIVSFTTATIDGDIIVASRSAEGTAGAGTRKDCGSSSGGEGGAGEVLADSPGTGGGGGGAFGGPGAAGGTGGCGDGDLDEICDSDGGEPGAKGDVALDLDLAPLGGGCNGGMGAGAMGGEGGLGGGAVQIAARDSVIVSGTIDAGGAAGAPSGGQRSGGGGGGAGGAILLESFQVGMSPTARLCANGGGGGAVDSVNPSSDALCDVTAAHGLAEGGDGATIDFEPTPGVSGDPREGGGGGGGGLGRIVIRWNELLEDAGFETPAYGN